MTTAEVRATHEGDEVTIVLDGEIDLANRDEVERQINDAITNQATRVRIDLTEVEYLDSAGLRILFTLATRLDRLQIDLELLAPASSSSRRAVQLSGLEAMIPVLPAEGP